MANRPVFENRPATDLAGLQSAVRRYVQDEQRYLDGALADLELPDVGPGAGTYGGGGELLELATLDAKGRVLGLGTTTRGTVDGSVLSMEPPPGADDPVVAYDFTRYDAALTTAQNLVAANLSGSSALDLSAQGAAKMGYLASPGGSDLSPYAWQPFACRSDGGALFVGGQADYVVTSGAPSALRFLGAMTAEILFQVTELASPGADDLYLYNFAAGGGTESANNLYELRYVFATGSWQYLHQVGVANNSVKGFFTAGQAEIAPTVTLPLLFTLTRAASTGVVKLYSNGRLTSTGAAASPAGVLPTGGTISNLSIGFGQTNTRLAVLGFRLFNAELTAAQVRTSYQRTFFGVSS